MFERYCDAVIIGTEIPGLITGAFLARRGLSVQIIDPYLSSEDSHPDPFCVSHLHSKLLRSILGRLNVPENEIQQLATYDHPLQFITPQKRIDVSSSPVKYYEELHREFPDDYENLKNFFENLIHIKHKVNFSNLYEHLFPSRFKEKRDFSKFIREFNLNQKVDKKNFQWQEEEWIPCFINSMIQLLTHSFVKDPFLFQSAELLNPSDGEILSIRRGHHFLKDMFIKRISSHEGFYRSETEIKELLFENGIFTGLQLKNHDGPLLSRYIIWNTDLSRLTDLIPNMLRFRGLKKSIKQLKPKAYWFTCQFHLPKNLIPEPMQENLLMVSDPTKPLTGDNYIYLQVNKEKEIAVISANYLLTADHLEKEMEFFLLLHHQIKKKIVSLIPYGKNQIKITFPLKEKIKDQPSLFSIKEDDFEIFKKFALNHPIYHQSAKQFKELFPLSYKTPAPNLFLTSQEIAGNLGSEGQFMLGLKVTDTIWDDVKSVKKRAMKNPRRIA